MNAYEHISIRDFLKGAFDNETIEQYTERIKRAEE